MAPKTKRQIVEERRGIHRGPDGKIVLTQEQMAVRVERFGQKRMESELRATRCRIEENMLRGKLGIPVEDEPPCKVDPVCVECEELRRKLEICELELAALKASIKPGFWRRTWGKIRSLWNG